jgi:hypothetical protein
VDEFSASDDGMTHVAKRVLQITKNAELQDEDKLNLIEQYCTILIESNTEPNLKKHLPLIDKWS